MCPFKGEDTSYRRQICFGIRVSCLVATMSFSCSILNALPPDSITEFYVPITARVQLRASRCEVIAQLPPINDIAACQQLYDKLRSTVPDDVELENVESWLRSALGVDEVVHPSGWVDHTLVIDGAKRKDTTHFAGAPHVAIRTPDGDTARRGGGKIRTQITRYDPGGLHLAEIRLYDLFSRSEGLFAHPDWTETRSGTFRIFERTGAGKWTIMVTDAQNDFVNLLGVYSGGKCHAMILHFAPHVPHTATCSVLVPSLTVSFARIASSSSTPTWRVACYHLSSVRFDEPIDPREFEESAEINDVVVMESDDGTTGEPHLARRRVESLVSTPKPDLRVALDPRLSREADPNWSLWRLLVPGVIGAAVLLLVARSAFRRQQK